MDISNRYGPRPQYTLTSGDESAMNFVPVRALFLVNFREHLF
jgi:hypothetical protein